MAGDGDDDKATGHIVGVVEDGLFVGRPPANAVRRVAFLLAGGAYPAAVLGEGAAFVPWSQLASLSRTEASAELSMTFEDAGQRGTVDFEVGEPAHAPLLYDRVRERRPDFVETITGASVLARLFQSVVQIGIIGVVGVVMLMMSFEEVADGRHHRRKGAAMFLVAQLLGPKVIGVVILLAIGVVLFQTVRFFVARPRVHTLGSVR